jgi:serine phosphatase RsbU (regulator of sigma subunit)
MSVVRPGRRLFGSISAKIALATVFLLAVVLVTFLGIIVQQLRGLGHSEAQARANSLDAALRQLASSLARNTASASEAALFDHNVSYLQALVDRAAREKDVRYAVICDEEGRVVVDSRHHEPGVKATLADALTEKLRTTSEVLAEKGPDGPDVWIFAAPIFSPTTGTGNEAGDTDGAGVAPARVAGAGPVRAAHIGQVRVAISLHALEEALRASRAAVSSRIAEVLRLVAVVAAILLALGVSVAVVEGMRISRPLLRLTEQAARIAGGDLERRMSVAGPNEIAHLSANFNFMADQIQALLEETRRRAALSKELEVARVVQESLVPSTQLAEQNGLRTAAFYEAALICGGDWWSVRPLEDDRILVLIGDVTGHGLPAALITAAAVGCCEVLPRDVRPELALSFINDAVLRAGQGRFYMTCFATVLDRRQGIVEYANAGHTFPYLARKAEEGTGWNLLSLSSSGPVLGMEKQPRLTVQRQAVRKGDLLIWFTDGATECQTADGTAWGERGFRKALMAGLSKMQNGHDRVLFLRDEVLASLVEFCGGAERTDDVTIVVGEVC